DVLALEVGIGLVLQRRGKPALRLHECCCDGAHACLRCASSSVKSISGRNRSHVFATSTRVGFQLGATSPDGVTRLARATTPKSLVSSTVSRSFMRTSRRRSPR